jgi:hypothetical protein
VDQTSRPSPGGRRFSGFALPFVAPSSTFFTLRAVGLRRFRLPPALTPSDPAPPQDHSDTRSKAADGARAAVRRLRFLSACSPSTPRRPAVVVLWSNTLRVPVRQMKQTKIWTPNLFDIRSRRTYKQKSSEASLRFPCEHPSFESELSGRSSESLTSLSTLGA